MTNLMQYVPTYNVYIFLSRKNESNNQCIVTGWFEDAIHKSE